MPQCNRCLQFPCRCTDSRDVIAEYYAQRSPPPDPLPELRAEPHADCDCTQCLGPWF